MRWALMIWFALLTPAAADQPVVTQLLSTRTTITGQPIVLPQGNVQLVVTRLVIPPGISMAVHKHPSQRYAYVLAGRLTITVAGGQVFSYKAGDFIVSARGMWHFSTPIGTEPAILLVIDQLGAGQAGAELMQGGH